jgi:hypothetical protein
MEESGSEAFIPNVKKNHQAAMRVPIYFGSYKKMGKIADPDLN